MTSRIIKFVEYIVKALNSPHSNPDTYKIEDDNLSSLNQNEIKIILDSGIIWKTVEAMYHCPECGNENEIKASATNKNYITCVGCGGIYEINKKSSEIYYTNLEKWADFLISGLELTSAKEVVDDGKLIFLGELEDVNGQPDVYLARGLNWQDEDFDYSKIALDKTILLSLVTPINSNIKLLKPGRVFVISDYLQISEGRLCLNRPKLFSKINTLLSSAQSKGGTVASKNRRGKAFDYGFKLYKNLLVKLPSDRKIAYKIADEIIRNEIKHDLNEDSLHETIRTRWLPVYKKML